MRARIIPRVADAQIHKTTVEPNEKGMRLDVWFASRLGVTRSQAQRLIRSGHVKLEKRSTTKSSTVLSGNMEVAWSTPEIQHAKNPSPLSVVFEDESILVVNKEAGVVVHPGSGVKSATLLDSIRAHLGNVSWDERGGLVHRLDKDTSGLLVIAKGPDILNALQEQWQGREVKKKYVALLVGTIKPSRGSVDAPIARSTRERMKMRVDASGKYAITNYEVTKALNGFSLVTLELVTGRTHQIRVHMAAIGFPVAGDETYGNTQVNGLLRAKGLKHQFLHAAEISFKHPQTGKEVTFQAPLPDDLQHVLKMLE